MRGGPIHLSKGIDSVIFKEPLKEDDQIIHNLSLCVPSSSECLVEPS